MPERTQPDPSRARSALVFGLEWAGGCLGLIVLIQVLGLLALWLFVPGATQPESGGDVFLTGVRVLLAFLGVALLLAGGRWATMAGPRRIGRWVRQHRWQVLAPVGCFAVIGVSASALQPQAPPWPSLKRPTVDCGPGDAKQPGRDGAQALAGAPKDPPAGQASLAAAPPPCPAAR